MHKRQQKPKSLILESLNSDNIFLASWPSHCYDISAAMAGLTSGLNSECAENPKAWFVRCDKNSLALVGMRSAKQD